MPFMKGFWQAYEDLLGREVIEEIHALAKPLQGLKVVHINSTLEGGGVAEILAKMVPLQRELGLHVDWDVIQGVEAFFECTKLFHNLLQGNFEQKLTPELLHVYEEITANNAKRWETLLHEADFVFIHDPQPLALIKHFPQRKGKWVWRCHIDCSHPHPATWQYLQNFIEQYDAAVFSMPEFAQKLTLPVYCIPPSIDPFTQKNRPLAKEAIQEVAQQFALDLTRPLLLQVSRFDKFKDPLGVIAAYRIAKNSYPQIQLVLVGGGAVDDPEGAEIFHQVQQASKNDPDIHVLLLPPNAHTTINALQRAATLILQKSLKEGFGLTISEGLWKQKPVIGGNTGGIRLQIIEGITGYLVNSIEETAQKICYLLEFPIRQQELGRQGKTHVLKNFLITRHLRDYLRLLRDLC